MSTSKIINDFNKCLLREKFLDFKYHLNIHKKQENDIKPLFESIKNIDSTHKFGEFNYNESITTTEAMNNPRIEKLSGYLKNITRNKKYKFYEERINSAKKNNYNIKSLDILKYSDCVSITEKKSVNVDAIFIQKRRNLNKNINKDETNNINRKRAFSSKLNNEHPKIKTKTKTTDYEINKDKHLNIYNNNKFKDTLSSFLYHVNNITAYQKENEKLNEEPLKKERLKFYNNDLPKQFTNQNNNIKKIKEINRFDVDISNIFLIQKPLMTSIRGKILKNLKKRFKRPVRSIIKSIIFYNHNDD